MFVNWWTTFLFQNQQIHMFSSGTCWAHLWQGLLGHKTHQCVSGGGQCRVMTSSPPSNPSQKPSKILLPVAPALAGATAFGCQLQKEMEFLWKSSSSDVAMVSPPPPLIRASKVWLETSWPCHNVVAQGPHQKRVIQHQGPASFIKRRRPQRPQNRSSSWVVVVRIWEGSSRD